MIANPVTSARRWMGVISLAISDAKLPTASNVEKERVIAHPVTNA
jgi:hypothetical protein